MSLQTQHDPKNEAEITYWNSAGGRHWVERQQSQDVVLRPILQATLERAQLRQGERVVDIGCGTSASSIALAERVGPSGQGLGVNVSAPMLARAAERLPPGAPVKFVRTRSAEAGAMKQSRMPAAGLLRLRHKRLETKPDVHRGM